jgi:hypothetical protein
MTSISRSAVALLAALLFTGVAPGVLAASRYVDAGAAGSHDGKSWGNAWTSFAQIDQSSLSGGDVVWVKSGTYDERFTIAKSGSSGQRITYLGTGPTRPVLRGIDGGAFTDVAIIDLEIAQLSTANAYAAIAWAGAARWLVQDNYIHDTYMSGIDSKNSPASCYNIIRHNTFADLGSIDGGSAGGNSGTVVVDIVGDRNLIEYNTVTHSMDRIRPFGTGNIVRNNYFGATDTALYPKSQVYPYHADGCQSFEGASPLVQFIYERNYDIDNRDTIGPTLANPQANGHSFIVQDTSGGTPGTFHWYIYRFNVAVREADSVAIFYNVNNVRWYNNTAIEAGIDHDAFIYGSAIGWDNGAVISDDYDFRNNTFDYCPNTLDASGIITTGNRPTTFSSAANHSYNTGAQGRLPAGASPDNLPQTAPLFTDGTGVAGHDDYTLTVASPLKGAAAPITTAAGSGATSTSLTVADARRLCDGWGIVEADQIKIGAGSYVRIVSIDYSKNVVTLASAQSWSGGDGVYVKGSEDVGALPYSYATPFAVTNTTPALVAGANTLSATVDHPDAVRMVEFLVDGLPVGISYQAPYSTSWTSDGASHSVIARAYAAWATPNLVSEAANSVLGGDAGQGIDANPVSPGLDAQSAADAKTSFNDAAGASDVSATPVDVGGKADGSRADVLNSPDSGPATIQQGCSCGAGGAGGTMAVGQLLLGLFLGARRSRRRGEFSPSKSIA